MRNPLCCQLLALVLGCLLLPVSTMAEVIYLDADFDDKTPDQVIGTGGAEVGEPFWVDLHAGGYIRQSLPWDPVLEIADGSTTAYGNIWFRFLSNAELESGVVVVTFTISFFDTSGGSYDVIAIREAGGGFVFVELRFLPNFDIELADADGVVGVIGDYNMAVDIPMAVALDLSAGIYDVWLDGQEVRSDEPVTFSGHKLGNVVLSTGQDEDLTGKFFIDDLFVTDNPDAVPVKHSTWGRVRSLFR